MAAVLHLLKSDATPLAVDTIRQQTSSGDRVTLVLLDGAAAPVGVEVTTRRVPDDLDYARLLDLIFEADRVVVW